MTDSKTNNRFSILFWPIAIVVLLLYNLTPRLDGFDTAYYFMAGENLWNGELDCLRTPVYPLLCKSFSVLFGTQGMAIALTVLQSIVYILSLFSLQRLATRAVNNDTLRNILLFFYVCCIAPGWCNEISTESLSISGTVILVDILFRFLDGPTFGRNFMLHIMMLMLLFLRPTFILFLVLLPLCFLLKMRRATIRKHFYLALTGSLLCLLCFGGYANLYKNKFGVNGTTSTFVFNKIYDAHRGGYWDPQAVSEPECRRWIDTIDTYYTNNYGIVYNTIMQHPESLSLINEGCDAIIRAHKAAHRQYRLGLFASSFDKRLQAAVNTHTPLSRILFASSLFLSFPLSLFYLFIVIALTSIVFVVLHRHRPSLFYVFCTIAVFAHTIGIALTTSDSFERLLLPVYPLFLLMVGICMERTVLSMINKRE